MRGVFTAQHDKVRYELIMTESDPIEYPPGIANELAVAIIKGSKGPCLPALCKRGLDSWHCMTAATHRILLCIYRVARKRRDAPVMTAKISCMSWR